jgi:hypothetical protein
MKRICCKDCEYHNAFQYGMKTATSQYTGHICSVEPHVGEFDSVYGEKKGRTPLNKNHLELNSPKWCPKK